MKRRFKSKKRKRKKYLIHIILIIIILLILISKMKISSENIIDKVIYDTKNETLNISKINNPDYILSNYIHKNEPNIELTNIKEEKKDYKVYIYSTHEKEAYKDNSLQEYNIRPDIKMMDYILKDYLEQKNIKTYVEKTSITEELNKRNLAYKYSYDISREIIKERLKEINNPNLIIDMHRDSSNLDKTLLEDNNKKYARILFVIGGENDNYQKNYKIAEILNNKLNEKVKNLSRGINIKKGEGVNGIYNQDLNEKIILIELGGQYNEIEELNNTLEILSNVIEEYIKEYNEE